MMRIGTWIVAVPLVLAVVVNGDPACAGGLTLEERVERLERRAEVPAAAAGEPSGLQERLDRLEAHVKNLPFGIKLGGIVVASYMYSLNHPEDQAGAVRLRAFDRDHNSFVLDLFQLQVSRAPGENGVGFVTKVNFGKTAERMAADWDGDGAIGGTSEEDNSVELQDAYITYNFPGLPELGIKGGKFVTLLGAEVIESPLNYNISRSLAFSWAIPFTHTGALMSYTLPQFGVTAGVVNGWDNVVDSNDGKSLLASIAITPVQQFSLILGGMYGAEQADRGDSKRGIVDVVMTIKPIETMAISLNYDYGNETELGPTEDNDVEWQAVSGIFAFDIPDAFAVPIGFAVRGEYFDDSDSSRLPGPAFGTAQNVWEVTSTFKIVLAEGLMARAEYRYDNTETGREVFLRRVGGVQEDQHTVAAELSYVF